MYTMNVLYIPVFTILVHTNTWCTLSWTALHFRHVKKVMDYVPDYILHHMGRYYKEANTCIHYTYKVNYDFLLPLVSWCKISSVSLQTSIFVLSLVGILLRLFSNIVSLTFLLTFDFLLRFQ